MKPIYNIDGRQDVKAAVFEVTEADFRLNDQKVTFDAEPGSVMIGARIKPVVAFDGATETLAFGTTDTPSRYGSALNIKATTALTPTLDDAVLGAGTISNTLVLTRTPGADPTEGVGRLRVICQFVRVGKADTTQGNKSAPSVPPNPGPNY